MTRRIVLCVFHTGRREGMENEVIHYCFKTTSKVLELLHDRVEGEWYSFAPGETDDIKASRAAVTH